MNIPFNRPFRVGGEVECIQRAFDENHQLSGNGMFTHYCHRWFEETVGIKKALLTHSCTGALEMCALLANLEPGDEVIMPSYTFVSTANAFVLRGAVPIFVDIREDTLNINESLIEDAITSRTKAITVVHYAGMACEMTQILEIAKRHDLLVIEDAAQGLMATYKGLSLGGIGDLGTVSFHDTKNLTCGEGGALYVNNVAMVERAEIYWEKGTDRNRFFRGEVDRYTWQDMGSSFLPSEVTAAFLWAQLQEAEMITQRRLKLWHGYHDRLESLELTQSVRRPKVPQECQHNAHMYYLLLNSGTDRQPFLKELENRGVNAISHYVPLHQSPAGQRYCRVSGQLTVTESAAESVVRLPLWVGMQDSELDYVTDVLNDILLTSG